MYKEHRGMTLGKAVAAAVSVAAASVASVFGACSPAMAAEPAVASIPSTPVIEVDQTRAYAPGDTVDVKLRQTVGDEDDYGKYSQLVMSSTLDGSYVGISDAPASLYKVSADGSRSKVDGAGAYTYDSDTRQLSFTFSPEYLASMSASGETYELDISLSVAKSDAFSGATGRYVRFNVNATTSAAIEGHLAIVRNAVSRPINVDVHGTQSASSSEVNDVTDDDNAQDKSPVESLVSAISSLLGIGTDSTTSKDDSGYELDSTTGTATTPAASDNTSSSDAGTTSGPDTDAKQGGSKQGAGASTTIMNSDDATGTDDTAEDGTKQQTTSKDATQADLSASADAVASKASYAGTETPYVLVGDTDGTGTLGATGSFTLETSITPSVIETGKVASVTVTASYVSTDISSIVFDMSGNSYPDGCSITNMKVDGTSATMADGKVISGKPLSNTAKSVVLTFDVTIPDNDAVTGGIIDVPAQAYGVIGTGTTGDIATAAADTVKATVEDPVVSQSVKVDNTTPQPGDTITFTDSASVTGGTAHGVVRSLSLSVLGIDDPDAYITASDGGTVSKGVITWAAESGTTLASHTVKLSIPDTAQMSGALVMAGDSVSGANITTSTTNPTVIAAVGTTQVNGNIKVDTTSPNAGDTVKFTASGTVASGSAHNAVMSVVVSGADDLVVSASDDGKVTKSEDGTSYTVTWASVSSSSSIGSHTVSVKIPDTVASTGKTITAKGTITGSNITDISMVSATSTVCTPTAGGTVTASSSTPDAGDKVSFVVSPTITGAVLHGTTMTVNVNDAIGLSKSDIECANGTMTCDKDGHVTSISLPIGDVAADGKIDPHTITVSLPVSTQVNGKSLSIDVQMSGNSLAPVSIGSAGFSVSSPVVTGKVSVDNVTPSAGDTITMSVNASVAGGKGINAITTMTIDGIADGATIAPSDGKTAVKSGDKYVVTWGPVASVPAGDSIGTHTVAITLPKGVGMNGKSISATASVTGTSGNTNINETSLGNSDASVVQTPSVTLKKSATAVSDKPATNGSTTNSDGGTTTIDGTATKSDKSDSSTTADDGKGTSDDGVGGDDVNADTNPAEKSDSNVVINTGDSIAYVVAATQSVPTATAKDVVVSDSLDDKSSENGVYIDTSTLTVKMGDTDVTKDASIKWNKDSKPTAFSVSGLKMSGTSVVTVTYTAVAGESNNDKLRGVDVTNTASVTGDNFIAPDKASVKVSIASATLLPTINTDRNDVTIGDTVNYAVVVKNVDKTKSSIAKDVYVSSILNGYAASIGYAIDPTSLSVTSVDNGIASDITKQSKVTWDGTSSFSVDTSANLSVSSSDDGTLDMSKPVDSRYAGIDHAIIVSYSGTTSSVPSATTGSTTLTNSVITRANNATYVAANKSVTLKCADATPAEQAKGGSYSDTNGASGKSSVSKTGDVLVPVLVAVIGAAVVVAAIVVIRRKH